VAPPVWDTRGGSGQFSTWVLRLAFDPACHGLRVTGVGGQREEKHATQANRPFLPVIDGER
jgi:hypothetical protein